MIISNILGGLGNQLFQYATARAVAYAKGQPLYLDLSDFADYQLHRGFELARVFGCQFRVAEQPKLVGMLGWRGHPVARRLLRRPRFAWLRGKQFVVEPHFHYWSGINSVPVDCYLVGYWQSERYFRNIAHVIRSDFTFRLPFNARNAKLAAQIGRVNAISLHVRRGDYAKNSKTTATHGLCPLDYYRAAVLYIAERVDQPIFFIFSDDPVWVKENLKIDFPCRYVDHNMGAESYNDMRLMSLCRHHIIANSSFSWWGAWLNPNSDKIVVAPRRWFATTNYDVNDLFPQDWVTL